MNIRKLFNDEAGVSPIVATLVLVVVAIAGAAAVGTIMGSFSNEVSDQASVGDSADAASIELYLGGSSTVYPVAVALAEEYMDVNPGIKVDVQSSSSGTGVAAAGMNLVDIGAASRGIDPAELEKYPDLQAHQIGASAVVMVINVGADPLTDFEVTADEAAALYRNAATETVEIDVAGNSLEHSAGGTAYTIVKRVGDSGTQDTFCDYVGIDDKAEMETSAIDAKELDGNAAVAEYIKSTPRSIAFVDYGFATEYGLEIVGIDCTQAVAEDEDEVIAAINGETTTFPSGLTRPLNLITLGNPSAVEQSFISFAMQPGNANYFQDAGYFAMVDLV